MDKVKLTLQALSFIMYPEYKELVCNHSIAVKEYGYDIDNNIGEIEITNNSSKTHIVKVNQLKVTEMIDICGFNHDSQYSLLLSINVSKWYMARIRNCKHVMIQFTTSFKDGRFTTKYITMEAHIADEIFENDNGVYTVLIALRATSIDRVYDDFSVVVAFFKAMNFLSGPVWVNIKFLPDKPKTSNK